MNYQYVTDVPEGQLVIGVLRPEWLQRTAELLTDSFVDTKGIQPYRRYVRRSISTYLEQHIKMPPAAVLLTAILHTRVPAGAAADLLLDEARPASSSSSSSNDGNNNGSSSGSNNGISSGNGNTSGSSSSSDNNAGLTTTHCQQQQQLPEGAGSADAHSSSGSAAGPSNVGSMVRSALQQLSQGLGLQQQQQDFRTVQTLLGVTEVSFREVTRAKSLTLNPPAKGAYLCNMAVSRQWQRRGVATRLITAVEDVCLLAGEGDLFLHLRFKDTATAGQLYSRAGFSSYKADIGLVALLGQEPRYLMRKQLQQDRQLVGRLKLPAAGAAVTQSSAEKGRQEQQEAAGKQPVAAAAASPAA